MNQMELSYRSTAPLSAGGRHAAIAASAVASLGTLTCCALPALFVSLGAGATLASLVTAAPFLIVLSEHKEAVFLVSAALLAIAALLQWQARNAPCPVDPRAARWCMAFRRISWSVIGLSAMTTGVGAWFAFLAGRFMA